MSSPYGSGEMPSVPERPDMTGGGDGAAWPSGTLPAAGGAAPPAAAGGGFAAGSAQCSRCRARLPGDAAFCRECGHPVAGASSAGFPAAGAAPGGQPWRPAAQQLSQFVVVTGLSRVAGWLVLGGGAALVLSTLLPWFSVLGLVSGHLSVQYVLAFLAVGVLLGYFGIRTLRDQVTHAVMITLWVLAGIAAFATLILFATGQYVGNASYGAVSLSSGFYIGILGFLAAVAGTIVLQAARKSSRPS
jgi:hypothetical protein